MNVLVYGFYGKKNVGDNLFIDAFKKLFPTYTFAFTDNITKQQLAGTSTVFFGGGSFLDAAPNIDCDALEDLQSKNILYLGVGTETSIDAIHIQLMKQAKLIATRSKNLNKLKEINGNVIYIPDLVYALSKNAKQDRVNKSILYLPNISVVPTYDDSYWRHSAWQHFKLEFSQCLDALIGSEYKLDILSMCENRKMDDGWAAIEIINQMDYRNDYIIDQPQDYIDLFSQYQLVITQRYHGIILAELANTKYISIYHHDKLKSSYFNSGIFTSYFEISKQKMLDAISDQIHSNSSNDLVIGPHLFDELKHKVSQALNGERCQDLPE